MHAELQTIVQITEGENDIWKEVTRVTTVSKNGAGFSLSRPCTVGRLVTLVMPMPTELRAYDEDKALYPVMGLVQYCNDGMIDGKTVYHVGVGFIGKRIPDSFRDNPFQSYRISGMSKDGLWMVTEAESQFKARRHPRSWIAFDVTITLLQKDRKAISRETAVTQNIGSSGVSVRCSLDVTVGDKVKFAFKALDFYAIAIVRNRKETEGQTPTLHLEFVDTEFPMERLFIASNAINQRNISFAASETETPPLPLSVDNASREFELQSV